MRYDRVMDSTLPPPINPYPQSPPPLTPPIPPPSIPTAPAPPFTCPACHQPVQPNAYFCPNCGHNLKPTPPPTSLTSQLELYFKSALLPPMGIIWGMRYLKQPDFTSKIVGLIAIGITVAVLLVVVIGTIKLFNTINDQVNTQMENIIF